MGHVFTVPDDKTIRLWMRGDPITDDQLALLRSFFENMVAGSEALGERFSLATMALRAEMDRAEQITHHRKAY